MTDKKTMCLRVSWIIFAEIALALPLYLYSRMNAWDDIYNGLNYEIPEFKKQTGSWPKSERELLNSFAPEHRIPWSRIVSRCGLRFKMKQEHREMTVYAILTRTFGADDKSPCERGSFVALET